MLIVSVARSLAPLIYLFLSRILFSPRNKQIFIFVSFCFRLSKREPSFFRGDSS